MTSATTMAAWNRISADLHAAEAEKLFSDTLRHFGNLLRLAASTPLPEDQAQRAAAQTLRQCLSALYLAGLRLRGAATADSRAQMFDDFRIAAAAMNVVSGLSLAGDDACAPLLQTAGELIRQAHAAYGVGTGES
jgi:hypothetical protein